MNRQITNIAKEYYTLLANKDFENLQKLVHEDIEFKAPLAQLNGKEDFLEALKGYASLVNSITFLKDFKSEDEEALFYEVDLQGIQNNFPTAAYFTIKDGKVFKLKLYYDARAFMK